MNLDEIKKFIEEEGDIIPSEDKKEMLRLIASIERYKSKEGRLKEGMISLMRSLTGQIPYDTSEKKEQDVVSFISPGVIPFLHYDSNHQRVVLTSPDDTPEQRKANVTKIRELFEEDYMVVSCNEKQEIFCKDCNENHTLNLLIGSLDPNDKNLYLIDSEYVKHVK
jgi:hypothetical protein